MFKYYICLLLIPYTLMAFEPRLITPQPVVGFRTQDYFDDFQKTKRQLLIWYPVEASTIGKPSESPWDVFKVAKNAPIAPTEHKREVIILSHGYTGNPHQLSWLIRGLVYHGFIVIAVQHMDLKEGKAHANHWQRAQDVRLLIDQFGLSAIAPYADPQKIGIAGFSLGGTTAVWVAGGKSTKLDSLIPGPEFASPKDYTRADEALLTLNKFKMAQDWRDNRVRAAFIMAPGWAWLFDEKSLRRVAIPTYFIAPSADKVLVTRNNAGLFARLIPEALYQEISGKANHYIFISTLDDVQQRMADPQGELRFLFEEDASIDRTWLQFQIAEEAARFFKKFLVKK